MNLKDSYSPFYTGENLGLDQKSEAFTTPRPARKPQRRRIPERVIQAKAKAVNSEWTQIMCDRWRARQEQVRRELERAEREAETDPARQEYRRQLCEPATVDELTRWHGEW